MRKRRRRRNERYVRRGFWIGDMAAADFRFDVGFCFMSEDFMVRSPRKILRAINEGGGKEAELTRSCSC